MSRFAPNQIFAPPPPLRVSLSLERLPASSMRGSATLVDGKQLAAVCRIKALWRLHCFALPICVFGEGDRPALELDWSAHRDHQPIRTFLLDRGVAVRQGLVSCARSPGIRLCQAQWWPVFSKGRDLSA
jgi:hypothetical protein